MTMKDFVEDASAIVERFFLQQKGLSPICHFVTGDDKHGLIGTNDFSNQDTKDAFSAALKQLFQEHKVKRYVLCTEAWMVTATPERADDATKLACEGRLSEHPDRKEMIVFNVEDEIEGQLLAYREIIRNGDEVSLGVLNIQPSTTINEGRFTGLLPKAKRTVH